MVKAFFLIVVFSLFFVGCTKKKAKKTLKIFTYPTFMGVYGPGPELKKLFEKTCDCQVNYFSIKNSALFKQSLKLNEKREMDIALGLDQFLIEEIENSLWAPLIEFSKNEYRDKIQSFYKPTFVMYDWAPLGLLFKKKTNDFQHQKSLKEFLLKNENMSYSSPETSTPGLHFLFWVLDQWGEEGVQRIKDLAFRKTSSWSQSYGLFSNGRVDKTFSYITSRLYHLIEENKKDVNWLSFDKYPVQVEYAGLFKTSKNKQLAKEFLRFLLSEKAQRILLKKNYMLPATKLYLYKEARLIEELPIYSLQEYKVWSKEKMLKVWKKF